MTLLSTNTVYRVNSQNLNLAVGWRRDVIVVHCGVVVLRCGIRQIAIDAVVGRRLRDVHWAEAVFEVTATADLLRDRHQRCTEPQLSASTTTLLHSATTTNTTTASAAARLTGFEHVVHIYFNVSTAAQWNFSKTLPEMIPSCKSQIECWTAVGSM